MSVFHATLMSTADIFNIVGFMAPPRLQGFIEREGVGAGRYNSSRPIPKQEVIPRRREHVSDPIVFRGVPIEELSLRGPCSE